MSDVNILKRMIDPLVELMAHKNLKVSFRGQEAFTEYNSKTGKPTKITLPIISSDADPSIISVYQGYVDHEVGHVLFTDCLNGKLTKRMKSKALMTFFNVVEDPRVEIAMEGRFKGCAHNLANLHNHTFGNDYIENTIPDDIKDPMHIFGGLIFAVRACSGQRYFKRKIDEYKKLQPIYEVVEKRFGEDIRAMKDSKDAMNVAKKLFDVFGDQFKALEAMGLEVVEEVTLEEGETGDGKSSKKIKAKVVKKDSKAPSEKSGSSDGEGESKEKESTEGKDGSKAASDDKPDEAKEIEADKKSASAWMRPEDCKKMYDDEIVHRMKFKPSELCPSGYNVKTTDDDEVTYIEECSQDHPIRTMEEETRSMTGVIQKMLERAMAAKSLCRWHTGYRRGKLHSATLSRLFFKDDRVFRKKEYGISKDVAVTLLIDCSGSMHGSKAKLAATSAYALANVLNNMGITCELIGFTTKGASYGRDDFSRIAPLYMPIFKAFNDHWNIKSKRRLGNMFVSGWMANNVDGESVQIAANRLLARPENGKIMIVLSDGWPNADGNDADLVQHLKDTVKELENKIKIVAIGIKSDGVEDYYSKNVVLNEIEELPGTVIKKLQEQLLS